MRNTVPLPLRRTQAGFTLIELMVAMIVGMILMMVLANLFIDAVGNVDAMLNKAQLNRQARAMFDELALGGFRKGVNATAAYTTGDTIATDVNYNYIFGLRGRIPTTGHSGIGWALPSRLMSGTSAAGPWLYTLGLTPTDAFFYTLSSTEQDSDVLSSDSVPAITVTCTDINQPDYGCSSGQTISVTGYLRMDPVFPPATSGTILEIVFDLYNPEVYGNGHIADDEISTVYWTAFTSLIDQVPP